jgi:hypothetical protein
MPIAPSLELELATEIVMRAGIAIPDGESQL